MSVTRQIRSIEMSFDPDTGAIVQLTIFQRKLLANPDIPSENIVDDGFIRVTPAEMQGSEENDLFALQANDLFPILNREDPIS